MIWFDLHGAEVQQWIVVIHCCCDEEVLPVLFNTLGFFLVCKPQFLILRSLLQNTSVQERLQRGSECVHNKYKGTMICI